MVDTAGDSVFGEFDSVVLATRCAQAIQADQARATSTAPPERRIETRIGVHVGDVIVEEYKIYGDGVNIAARLESTRRAGRDHGFGSRVTSRSATRSPATSATRACAS